MSDALETSFALCRRVARREARNFYCAFLLGPADARRAMCALYAFLRRTDDLGDNDLPVDVRRADLKRWRESFTAALEGRFDDPLLPALRDTVDRYGIPPQHLHEVIDGVEMDLTVRRYETWEDLRGYCRKVASAVGLCCIRIWGCHAPEAAQSAENCGLAFQLTNILRDLREDALADRMYLPADDMRRFDYSADDLFAGVCDERYCRLIAFQAERADELYAAGWRLAELLDPSGRRIFTTLHGTYRRLLAEIRRDPPRAFHRRARVSRLTRLRIAAGALWGGAP